MRVASLLGSLAVGMAFGAETVDLLKAPVVLRGSGFKAVVIPGDDRVHTTNYYTNVNDGDTRTSWEPMEARGPHFIEMLWNQDVRASGFGWQTEGVKTATLSRWGQGRWIPVATIRDNEGKLAFEESESDRWRISLDHVEGTPRISELSLVGPEQYILPREIKEGAEPGRLTLRDVQVPSNVFHPGDRVRLSFRVEASAVAGTYGLMVELSDRAALEGRREDRSDFCSGRWAARPDRDGCVRLNIELPPWTPQGANDILVFAVSDRTNCEIPLENQVLGTVSVERPDFPAMLEPVRDVRVGDNADGQRGFIINGKWHPAFFNRYYGNPTPERLAATAKTGLQILYWQNREGFPVEDEETMSRRLVWFDQRIRMALRINPQNYFILSQRAKPSRVWRTRHPEELMRLENGEPNPNDLVSFGSDLYLEQSEDFIRRLIEFVSRQPYGDRVIGYHLWTCSKNDGFIGGADRNGYMENRDDFLLGDYHPGALRLFREFLRKKYRNDPGALRRAWRNDAVTFETALVGKAELLREDRKGTVFRDPVRSRPAIDYLEFFPSMLSRYFSLTGGLIKRLTGGKALVLVHYGAVKGCLARTWAEQLQANNNDLESVLDDPNIDVFVQAQPYNTRESGNAMHVFQPVKSIDLHGKLYLFDHDPRTLGSGILRYGRHRSRLDGASIFARDYGYQWIENSGAWISDMSLSPWGRFDECGLPWFTMPEVYKPIRKTLDALQTLDGPRRSAAEIAVVLSLNSPRYEDACRMSTHYKCLLHDLALQSGFPYLGAPHDVILSGDLCRTNLPEYKLYAFLNPTYFTPAERKAIDGLKRDGKVLAWFYAPGYATDEGLSVEAVKDVSGFDLALKDPASDIPSLVYQDGSPLTRGLAGKKLTMTTWGSKKYTGLLMGAPVFGTTDASVVPAGRYADGTVAYGHKDFGSWKSVWCGVPSYDLPSLVNLARFAGVHLYADAPVVLNADNRMMMLHNGYESNRVVKVSLPRAAHVTSLYTGETVADGREFEVKLGAPDTRLLRLDYEK